MAPLSLSDGPTEAEQRLWSKFLLGEPLDIRQEQPDGAGLVHLRDSGKIRADKIRSLLLSDPHVVTGELRHLDINGAFIMGELDLSHAEIDFPLRFAGCYFDSPLKLTEARLRSVSLCGCHGQGIEARHVTVDGDLELSKVQMRGPVLLPGAHLRDDLHLKGASIVAPGEKYALDLSNVEVKGKIDAEGMTVEGSFSTEDARVNRSLHLKGATITTPMPAPADGGPGPAWEKAWCGEGMTVQGLFDASGLHVTGQVSLAAAHVLKLKLEQACVTAPNAKSALDLDNIEVRSEVDAKGMTVEGLFTTVDARVHGSLDLSDVTITVPSPVQADVRPRAAARKAWRGEGMTVQGLIDASRLHVTGQVSLIAAHVLDLVLAGAQIESTCEALVLDRLVAQGMVCCDEGSHLTGGLRAVGISVGSVVCLRRATVQAVTGQETPAAVNLSYAQIKQNLIFMPGFHAIGQLDLTGTHIGGRVQLDKASLETAEADGESLVLNGSGAEIAGDLSASDFTATGTMKLVNARIGGDLKVRHPDRAPCITTLDARGASITHNADLDIAGTIHVGGATITGDLRIELSRLAAPRQKPAADLAFITAGTLVLSGTPAGGCVDLTRATVRLLDDQQAQLSSFAPPVLDGFRYSDVAGLGGSRVSKDRKGVEERLEWLKAGTRLVRRPDDPRREAGNGPEQRPDDARYATIGFVRQPYQQLAAVYQRAGKDWEPRRILRVMYRERNAVKTSRGLAKAWNYVQDGAIGYGYSPSLAFMWLMLLFLLNFLWLEFGTPNSTVRSFLLPLDLVLPATSYSHFIKWNTQLGTGTYIVSTILVLGGVLLGATVIAAIARAIKR